jgi:ubiquinone/menaquinone biosynthesis C-methylase UbiE
MMTVQKDWDWWAYHYRVVHREQIPGIRQWDDDLVEMIVKVLGLQPPERVLDLACGSGVHALRLAQRGLEVVGVDIAASLIAHCRQKAAEEGITTAHFEQGDMRELAYEGEFDAVLLLSGSFGFFDEATNRDVLARVARALRKPGSSEDHLAGRMLIDVFDPTQMVVRPPRRSWSHYGGGYGLRTTWWEPETCTYVSEYRFIDADGVLNTAAEPERIRVYSLPEWRTLFEEAGLTMIQALADTKLPLVPYDRDHYDNLVIVGEKGSPQPRF